MQFLKRLACNQTPLWQSAILYLQMCSYKGRLEQVIISAKDPNRSLTPLFLSLLLLDYTESVHIFEHQGFLLQFKQL